MNGTIAVILLGILEGLTEFLPVSSTGHLVLLETMLETGLSEADEATFSIFIQLGAILAIVFLYPERFKKLFAFQGSNGIAIQSFTGVQGLMKLAIACFPVLFCGLLFHSIIKEVLLSPVPVAVALAVGGAAMIVLDRPGRRVTKESIEDLTYLDCLLIGVTQCLALWPGMSRSGSTIIGGMLLGASRLVAAEFSFFVAVPVMCAAVGYDLLKTWQDLSSSVFVPFSIGFIVSFVVAVLAVKFFIALLDRWSLRPFGYYRIVLGVVVLGVYWMWLV